MTSLKIGVHTYCRVTFNRAIERLPLIYDGPSARIIINIASHQIHTTHVARGFELPQGKSPAFLQLNRRQEDSTVRFYNILG